MDQNITFVCISDSHGQNYGLPQGDVLIHCGDFTKLGLKDEMVAFITWLKKQPFKYKIVVAGNHDISLDVEHYETNLKKRFHQYANLQPQELLNELKANCIYLENSSTVIEGYKIWGSPYSLEFCDWAFQLQKEHSKIFWSQIEDDSDIVITHGPPLNHGDEVNDFGKKCHVGDEELLKRILEIKPKYHFFGHIHEGYGQTEQDGIKFINCSILTKRYKFENKPYVFTLPKKL